MALTSVAQDPLSVGAQHAAPLPLAPYRVLDLSPDPSGFGGKLLGDLGADVILVEPPGGHPYRCAAPFYHDEPHPERSLAFWAVNTSKRSITLDITQPDGQDILKALATRADFLIEPFPTGHLDSLGLDYAGLSRLNPGLVMASITPFGQTGPYAHYQGTDLIAQALGGLMFVCGQGERPPVRITLPQASFQAGLQTAVACLIAHHYREATGRGQHIDVSMQEAIAGGMGLNGVHQAWDLNRTIVQRLGIPYQQNPPLGVQPRTSWVRPCKDGYMSVSAIRTEVAPVLRWLKDAGIAPELSEREWSAPEISQLPKAERDIVEAAITRLLLAYTKAELYSEAVKRRIAWHIVSTPQDLLESDQLRARGYFVAVEHPELGESIVYPGTPILYGGVACRVRRRPPLIGEHNEEVLGRELGLSARELAILRAGGVI
ncbi:MAG: CoA transferase [Chloroflexi bacterium]|nr:CoA transferase [Chloroflexota bacterium]